MEVQYLYGARSDIVDGIFHHENDRVLYMAGALLVSQSVNLSKQEYVHLLRGGRHKLTALTLSKDRKTLAFAVSSSPPTIKVQNFNDPEANSAPIYCTDISPSSRISRLQFTEQARMLLAVSGPKDRTSESESRSAPQGSVLLLCAWQNGIVLASMTLSLYSHGCLRGDLDSHSDQTGLRICWTGENGINMVRYTEDRLRICTAPKPGTEQATCVSWTDDGQLLIGTRSHCVLQYNFVDNEIVGFLRLSKHRLHEISDCKAQHPGNLSPPKSRDVIIIKCLKMGIIVVDENMDVFHYRRVGQSSISAETLAFLPVARYVLPPNQLQQAALLSGNSERFMGLSVNDTETNMTLVGNTGQLYSSDLLSIGIPSEVEENRPSIQMELFTLRHLTTSFHRGAINDMSAAVWRPLVVTSGTDRSVHIWNYERKTCLLVKQLAVEISTVAFHPLGHYIAVGAGEELCLLSVGHDDLTSFFSIAAGHCRQIVFSRGGHLIAVCVNNNIRLFCFVSLRWIGCLEGHAQNVVSIHWQLNDAHILTCDTGGALYTWDIHNCTRSKEYISQSNREVIATTASSDGKIVYLTYAESSIINEINVDTELERTFRCSSYGDVTYMALNENAKILLCATSSGQIISRNLRDSPEAAWNSSQAHQAPLNKVIYISGADLLATCCHDGVLTMWNVTSANEETNTTTTTTTTTTNNNNNNNNNIREAYRLSCATILVDEISYQKTQKELDRLRHKAETFEEEKRLFADVQNKLHQTKIEQMKEECSREIFLAEQRVKDTTEVAAEKVKNCEKNCNDSIALNEKRLDQLRTDLSQKLVAEYCKLEKLQTQLRASEQENKQKLEKEAEECQATIEALKSQHAKDMTAKTEETATCQRDYEQLASSMQQREALLAEISRDEQEEMKFEFEQQVDKLNNDLLTCKQQVALHKHLNARLERKISELDEQLNAATNESNKKSQIIDNIEQEMALLQKNFNHQSQQLHNKENEIIKLKQSNTEIENSLSEQKSALSELKQKSKQEHKEMKHIMEHNSKVEKAAASAEQKLSQLQRSHYNLKQKLAVTLKQVSAQSSILHQSEASATMWKNHLITLKSLMNKPAQLRIQLMSIFEKHDHALKNHSGQFAGEDQKKRNETKSSDDEIIQEDRQSRDSNVIAIIQRKHRREKNTLLSKIKLLSRENSCHIRDINELRRERAETNNYIKTMEKRTGTNPDRHS